MSIIKAVISPSISIDESGESTRLVRKGMFVAVGIVGSFFLWASFAPLNGAVITEGKVKIATNRKTIQHLEGGIVKEILVRDGDMVKEGQPLVLLENTRNSAEVNILMDQQDVLVAKVARLTAEKSLASKVAFPKQLTEPMTDKRKEVIAAELELFASRRKMLDDQIALLNVELKHSREEASAYQAQLKAIEENIHYKEEQVAMRESLLQKNFVGKADVMNYRQSLTDKKEQYSAQTADFSSTQGKIANLQRNVVTVKNKYIQDADTELKETSNQLLEVREKLRPVEDSMNRRTVKAPIDGQVIAMKVTTVGGVINAGQPIMDIVPKSDDLVVEVKVKTTDIDNVSVDQPAEVQLNAYNQRTSPLVRGRVVYIANDSIEVPNTGESYYPAHVKIEDPLIKKYPHMKVEPGMPATAYIQTHARTMMDYLISPITERMRHTFRED